MSVPPELAAAVRSWMTKAAHDLKNAENTLATLSDPECPLDTVCFHAQQCAEKSLKAFLTFRQIPFEKTHDLGQILYRCREAPELIRGLEQLKELSRYAADSRYPGSEFPPEEITRAEAESAVGLARKAYEAVRRQLGPALG